MSTNTPTYASVVSNFTVNKKLEMYITGDKRIPKDMTSVDLNNNKTHDKKNKNKGSQMKCVHFVKGNCRYGSRCKLSHQNPILCPSCEVNMCLGKQCKSCHLGMELATTSGLTWIPKIKQQKTMQQSDDSNLELKISKINKTRPNKWKSIQTVQPIFIASSEPAEKILINVVQLNGSSYYFRYLCDGHGSASLLSK